MPRLAAYFGDTNSNFLIETTENTYELVTFPYSYELRLFANQANRGEFYKQIVELFLKTYKKKIPDFDIYVASVHKDISLPFEVKGNIHVSQVIEAYMDYQVMLISSKSVYAKGFLKENLKPVQRDQEDSSFYDNVILYPQIIPNDISAQTFIDASITSSIDHFFTEETPVIFSGERFNNLYQNNDLAYVTMLEIIKKSGIYDIYVSPQNGILLVQLLKMFVKNIQITPLDFVVRIGSLVRAIGGAECLIKSDIGTQQFFEVKKNSVFTLPLLENEKSTISVKSHDISIEDRVINGGEIGLIVDTREKDSSIYSEMSLLNDVLKQFSQRITSIC